MLYCANTLDYQIFSEVQKHLPPLKILAKDKKAQQELLAIGVKSKVYPAFPKAVIMCRQAGYKFPVSSMIKIGMRHGAYTFKPFANSKGYNLLDYFYMTSSTEVKRAEKVGIKCGLAIGFPKLDPAFNGEQSTEYTEKLKTTIGINKNKKTLLFTATWNDSGVAAVDVWFDKLDAYTDEFNVLVTVHPWTDPKIKQTIQNTPNVYFIDSADVVPFIQISDVCIGDTSSILAECCALDKAIITFKVDDGKRTVKEVKQMIADFSIQIDTAEELMAAIRVSLETPKQKEKQRARANKIMFDELDGKAGFRAAEHIKSIFPELQ